MKYYPSPEQTYDFVSYSSQIAINGKRFGWRGSMQML